MAIKAHPMAALRGTQQGRDLMAQVRAHKGGGVTTFSAQQRRTLAAKGHALKDGSYPIRNASDLGHAATLAKSGHGNVAAAKALIGRRAKELGVSNPLGDTENAADNASEPGGEPASEKVAAASFMKRRKASTPK